MESPLRRRIRIVGIIAAITGITALAYDMGSHITTLSDARKFNKSDQRSTKSAEQQQNNGTQHVRGRS